MFLDGLEVGRVATYPSQPILLQPREPQSALALRFFRSSASTLETRVPNFGVEGFLANKELAISRSGGVFAEARARPPVLSGCDVSQWFSCDVTEFAVESSQSSTEFVALL